jgi:glyoxylase-like metal-dependent hydrolase (beta-lactamase superfamily II)
MKVNYWFLFTVIFIVRCIEADRRKDTGIDSDLSDAWFKTEQVTETIWRISDNGEDNIYLITGEDSALLVDNGLGAVDIKRYISRITTLPLIVLNTHGHPDHVGSNNQFTAVYAHPGDFDAITNFTNRTVQKQMLQYMVRVPIPDSLKFVDADTMHHAVLRPVNDGYLLNLGNREVEVIHTPGHTKGSICLLDRKDRVLFTGDHIKLLAWLHTEEALSMEEYLESLQKIKRRASEFDRLLPGHDSTLNKDFLQEQIICAENIVNGKCRGANYESVVGNGLLCSYKRAKIAYAPDKIKAK